MAADHVPPWIILVMHARSTAPASVTAAIPTARRITSHSSKVGNAVEISSIPKKNTCHYDKDDRLDSEQCCRSGWCGKSAIERVVVTVTTSVNNHSRRPSISFQPEEHLVPVVCTVRCHCVASRLLLVPPRQCAAHLRCHAPVHVLRASASVLLQHHQRGPLWLDVLWGMDSPVAGLLRSHNDSEVHSTSDASGLLCPLIQDRVVRHHSCLPCRQCVHYHVVCVLDR